MSTKSLLPLSSPLVLAVSLGAVAIPAIAGPDAASTATPVETMTVSATRVEQSPWQLSNSLSVISEKDLQLVSHVHISELLARAPGTWISRGNGQEHLTAIRSPVLTGAGSCGSFYIAEDGVPVRPVGFCNVNELFDLNTEQAQRIEVIRGPGTVLHGSDAQHGVINVINRAPSEDFETLLGLEAGPHDYGRVKLSVGDTEGRHGYRINLNGASDGGYQHDAGFDQQKMTLRHDYQGDVWTSRSLISASNLNQETAGYVTGTDAYKDDSRKRENGDSAAYRDTRSLRWQTRFEKNLNNGGVFVATPYARDSEMDFLMHFLPGAPVEESGQTSAGLQTLYRRPVSDTLTLTQGVDMEFTDAWLKQTQVEDSGFSSLPIGKQYDYEVDAQLLAAFLAAEQQWTDHLTASLGARYEVLDYDYNNRMISGNTNDEGVPCGGSGCRYTRPQDREDDFENLSADAGLVYRHSDAIIGSLRLSHGRRAPQATELYRLQAGQTVANLDAEEINSIELGLKGLAGTVEYQLVGFYMKKNNVIFQSSDRLNLDNGQTRHYGLEYQLAWQFAEQWDIGTAGTFARHEYATNVTEPGSGTLLTTKGNDVDTAPRRMATVQLGWEPTAATRLELEWVAMGGYYTDIHNLHRYDGHNLLHLRLRQQLSDNTSFGLRVHNLTDEDYAERADYSSLGGGDRYFIGEPRAVYGDIQFRF